MIAIHLENLVFLLLVAVAFLFQLLTRAAAKMSKDADETEPTPPTPPPIPRAKPSTDQERIREFLEALGQPTTSKPPEPAPHRTDIPPRPVAPVRPPPGPFSPGPWQLTREQRRKSVVILHESPGDLRRVKLPGQITQPPYEREKFKPKTVETGFEVREATTALLPEPAAAAQSPTEPYAIESQPTVAPQRAETNFATLLRSASGLRQAIILREIFGPPRSLQPLDPIGTV